MTDVDFFFDFISPCTYLALTQLDAIAARTGVRFQTWPMHLLNLLKIVAIRPPPWPAATNGSTPVRISQDGALARRFRSR